MLRRKRWYKKRLVLLRNRTLDDFRISSLNDKIDFLCIHVGKDGPLLDKRADFHTNIS